MGFATYMDLTAEPPPRRGRPAVANDPKQRARHLECVEDRVLRGLSLKKVCRAHNITPPTYYCWLALVLTYDGSRADAIRRALQSRPHP